MRPADTHRHDKVNYLSSGFEGGMISVAALFIFYQAIQQIILGVKLECLGLGIAVTAGAAAVNLVLGLALLGAAKRNKSPLLKANGHHVLTDVWSSAAVLIALLLIKLTGWLWWDPVAAVIAAANILRVGLRLFVESLAGLLDASDPEVERKLREKLDKVLPERGASYHNLRHRYSGKIHWVELHLVVDDSHSVRSGHQLATEVEALIAAELKPEGRVITHLEPKSAEKDEEAWEVR
ncbi:MAG TPA: cation diffusion facilitator family transporter [Luteolibacter sp.]|nr:cation diffusion facilitator family transporter [Luteolibacter sp.]